MASIYTVGQINSYTSGHIYFTLKDDTGTIAAVLFAGNAGNVGFRLENGMQVTASGKIDVYERDGRYQLYVYSVEKEGTGDLYRRFEQLKNELEEMGMFAQEYKKPIPKFARTIGIVTASTGAAVQDIINISRRRNPYVQLVLYPAIVQGELAKESIVKGIRTLDRMKPDVIIVGRGGGSIEDLWAFNEEIVAKAIFDASTPIISAVGHETDFTIADFTADMRAPTPSAAAELATVDITQLEGTIDMYAKQLNALMQTAVEDLRMRLEHKVIKLQYLNPVSRLNDNRMRTMELDDRLRRAMKDIAAGKRHELAVRAERLYGLSPLKALKSGYAYVEDENAAALKSADNVNIGDSLKIHMSDGSILAEVTGVERGILYGKDDNN